MFVRGREVVRNTRLARFAIRRLARMPRPRILPTRAMDKACACRNSIRHAKRVTLASPALAKRPACPTANATPGTSATRRRAKSRKPTVNRVPTARSARAAVASTAFVAIPSAPTRAELATSPEWSVRVHRLRRTAIRSMNAIRGRVTVSANARRAMVRPVCRRINA